MPLLIPPLVAHSVVAPQLLASIGRQLSADGPVHEQVHRWPASLDRRIWQTQYSIH
ncbi:hypothetical protein ACWD8I_21935 [Micromonospora arida]|uniref:hypothetical protein n=1 Tax=Micromonospora arida TaxID=2203715 RepID=UPI0033D09A1B